MTFSIRHIVRRVASLALVASLAFTGWSYVQFFGSTGGRFVVDTSQAEMERVLTALVNGRINQDALEAKLREELAADQRNWVVIDSLMSLATDRGFDLSPEVRDLYDEANGEDRSAMDFAADCIRCAWDSSSCEISTAMLCGIALDMSPVGDVAGISRAGVAFAQGEEIDKLDVALSAVGLSMTVLALPSGGTSLPVKAGASTLKFAHRLGSIPPRIVRVMEEAATTGIDWSGLRGVRHVEDLHAVVHVDALRPVVDVASDTGRMIWRTDPAQGMYLLKASYDIGELKQVSRATEVLGVKTAGTFSILGKTRVLRTTWRLAHGAWDIIAGLLGAVASLLLGTASFFSRAGLKRLRRI